MRSKKTLLALLMIMTLCMPGCGGSDGSSTSAVTTAKPAVVEGIAAAGEPVSGTLTISDASYPTKKVSTAINQDGTFSVAIDGLTPPLLLKAEGNAAGTPTTLYSFSRGAGTVQVNPLTSLLVAAASGVQGKPGLFELYSSHNRASLQSLANYLPGVTRNLQSALQPLLALYGSDGTDPFTAPYRVNHQGLDGLFDVVAFDFANGLITLTNKTTGAVIFSGQLDNLANSTLTTANLPAPVSYAMPGNARLTLRLSGLPAGTTVKRLKTVIRLPLGVTVDQGAAAINTAVPAGGAAGAVVYPLPSLSPTNNELTVEFSSLQGFGNGEILTLRCIVAYSALDMVRATDYTVLQTQLYGDIYKSVKINTGAVAPSMLVFPAAEGQTIYSGHCVGCHTLNSNDTMGKPSLLNKASLIPGKFAPSHRGISLTQLQIEDLQAYLVSGTLNLIKTVF